MEVFTPTLPEAVRWLRISLWGGLGIPFLRSAGYLMKSHEGI